MGHEFADPEISINRSSTPESKDMQAHHWFYLWCSWISSHAIAIWCISSQ
jgi:hypothetical protein